MSGNIARQFLKDGDSDSLVQIDLAHHMTHLGKLFFTKDYVELTGASATALFMFETPAVEDVHARMAITADAGFDVIIWEGCTVAAMGTTVTTYNSNRQSDITPSLQAYAGPTIVDTATSLGTRLWATRVGTGKETTGVTPGLNFEIEAKKSTKYIFEIQKLVAGDGYLDYDFFWYENGV